MYQTQDDNFKVTDDLQAERLLIKRAELIANYERIAETCRKQAEFYTQREAESKEECAQKLEGIDLILRQYLFNVECSETITLLQYELPSAKIAITKARMDFAKVDDKEPLDWAKKNAPEYIKTKTTESLAWAELKKELILTDDGQIVLESTGEVVQGIELVNKPEKMKIKYVERMKI